MACEKKTVNTDIHKAPHEAVPATREQSPVTAPPVDIYETAEGLMVLADLPGVAINDVDISVEEDQLIIRGQSSTAPGAADSQHREFRLADFHRQFELGKEVDQEKISAEAMDGVLTISLPRAEKVKPKKIEVKVA